VTARIGLALPLNNGESDGRQEVQRAQAQGHRTVRAATYCSAQIADQVVIVDLLVIGHVVTWPRSASRVRVSLNAGVSTVRFARARPRSTGTITSTPPFAPVHPLVIDCTEQL
jgi:hypothetical protein